MKIPLFLKLIDFLQCLNLIGCRKNSANVHVIKWIYLLTKISPEMGFLKDLYGLEEILKVRI
jgi:hypothetical protein